MDSAKKVHDAKKEVGRWAPDEHDRFMMGNIFNYDLAIATYGKDWKKV